MLGSGFLWSLVALVKSLLGLAFFMLVPLFMMYKAFKGERFALPFIGPLSPISFDEVLAQLKTLEDRINGRDR
jgi:uncharacterized membrane protein